MPKKKAAKIKPTKKSRSRVSRTLTASPSTMSVRSTERSPEPISPLSGMKTPPTWIFAVILLVLIAGVAVWQNKGLLVAAVINGQPVWRLDLEKRMNDRYGQQTLEEIINEQLIIQAASKKNILVSDQETNSRITDLEKKLEGKVSLKDALAQQGLSMDEFRRQLMLQIMVEKLTADKTTVSDNEIAEYIDKNKVTMVATEEAGLQDEARTTLQNEKRSQAINEIFSQLKQGAKVTRYL